MLSQPPFVYIYQLVAEAATCTTNTRDEHPCPQRDLNPAITAIEQLQTYSVDCMATGIGMWCYTTDKYNIDRIIADL
jgi:hypothetical protein